MWPFRSKKKDAREAAVAAMSAKPVVVNVSGAEGLRLAASRLTSIRAYVTQRRDEGRPIDPAKLDHLLLETAELTVRLKRAGVEV